jgi:cell wall-associated NlpC family hydrolase
MVPEGKVLKVKKQSANWVKVTVGGKTGYVSAKYVKISTKFKKAVPVNDEKSSASVAKLSTTTTELSKVYTFRKQVVEYAKQFNGNPYLWGGTSLTNGADCSGFTQSVFKDNGISIPRTSRTQATSGKVISIKDVQPGDLIFYASSGRINHVALYIGSGKVISASSARSGIRITNYNYRSPYKVVSYIK